MSKIRAALILLGLFHVADAIYTVARQDDASPLKSIALAAIMFLVVLLSGKDKQRDE